MSIAIFALVVIGGIGAGGQWWRVLLVAVFVGIVYWFAVRDVTVGSATAHWRRLLTAARLEAVHVARVECGDGAVRVHLRLPDDGTITPAQVRVAADRIAVLADLSDVRNVAIEPGTTARHLILGVVVR